MNPIIPVVRKEPFDHPGWAFELKLDGFRCIADTLDGRLLSKHQNRMKRFDPLLGTLPEGYVFDGEIVCLDEIGKPIFNDLLFRRREPVYVAFDVLNVEGADVRGDAAEGSPCNPGSGRHALQNAKGGDFFRLRQIAVQGGLRLGLGRDHREAAR
jgi:hypothetical protein